jgi:hypothetical protein
LIPETIYQKLEFARTRLEDFEKLIAKNKLGSDPSARHQLTQEFFFHLLGSTEYLAQLVNESRGFGIDADKVAIYKIVKELENRDPSDSVIPHLKCLSVNTKQKPLPEDPYSDEGLIYRIINYRNEVVHRNTNPFHFKMSAGPKVAFFWLDPRDHSLGQSKHAVNSDLSNMYSLVDQKCRNTLKILG